MVHHDVGVVNSSVVQLQAEAKKLSENIASLETRLKVIESQPQEKLIEQVDSIHHEVSNTPPTVLCLLITNKSMQFS